MRINIFFFMSCTMVFLCGCNFVGPRAIRRAGASYNQALQYTTDQQLLLNIVRLRYRDNPSFLEITSIATSYSLNQGLSVGAGIDDSLNPKHLRLRSISPSANLSYGESPTVTYQPLKGDVFVKQLLTPVPAETFLLLYYSGWSIERLFRCGVYRMNNVLNAPRASGPTPDDPPKVDTFLRVCKLLRSLQNQNKIYLLAAKEKDDTRVLLRLDKSANEDPEIKELRTILNLSPDCIDYPLVANLDEKDGQKSILTGTRSLMSMLFFLSHGVNVPPSDMASGLVTQTQTAEGKPYDWGLITRGFFAVHSDDSARASVAVRYRGKVFSIRDADLSSKSTFMLISQIFSLQAGEIKGMTPALTIPLGR